MNIVHLGIGIVPVPPGDEAGGREEYIYQLTDHLGRLECQVHVIDIKGGAPQKEKRQKSPVRFHLVKGPFLPYRCNLPFLRRFSRYILYPLDTLNYVLFSLLAAFTLNRLLSEKKIEVIHTHQRDAALAAVLVNKLRRARAVVLYTPQAMTSLKKWLRNVIHFAEIIALKWIDHVVALTAAYKDWLAAEYNLDPKKITPIHVGAAIDEIKQFRSQQEAVNQQSKIVLCVGGIMERKNQLTAVKAIARVVSTHPEVKLVFVGRISERNYFDAMRRFIAENGLTDHVEFKGEVTKQALYSAYSNASLFMFPTTSEIQPTVIIEALAFGLPIIASNIGANLKVLSQKEGSAFMVEPYDVDGIAAAVVRLLEDGSLRKAMSQKAEELAQSLSYEKVAVQTLTLYNKLVQDKRQSSS
ncbi:glycosyltransferase family 4 protein [Chloroflexota bacterium]